MGHVISGSTDDAAPASRAYDDALRIAREALERADREARERAAEVVRRAEEQARSIVASAERAAEQRAAEIVQRAEEKARLVPVPDRERLSALLTEIQGASGLLQEVQTHLEAILRAGEGDSPWSARTTPAPPVEDSRSAGSPETLGNAGETAPPTEDTVEPAATAEGAPPSVEPESPKPGRPGAHTIVRGLRAQLVDGQLVPVEDPPEEPRPEPKRGGWPFR